MDPYEEKNGAFSLGLKGETGKERGLAPLSWAQPGVFLQVNPAWGQCGE